MSNRNLVVNIVTLGFVPHPNRRASPPPHHPLPSCLATGRHRDIGQRSTVNGKRSTVTPLSDVANTLKHCKTAPFLSFRSTDFDVFRHISSQLQQVTPLLLLSLLYSSPVDDGGRGKQFPPRIGKKRAFPATPPRSSHTSSPCSVYIFLFPPARSLAPRIRSCKGTSRKTGRRHENIRFCPAEQLARPLWFR